MCVLFGVCKGCIFWMNRQRTLSCSNFKRDIMKYHLKNFQLSSAKHNMSSKIVGLWSGLRMTKFQI